MVVVEWSASSPSAPTIRVRILLITNFLFEKTKVSEKETGVGPSLKKHCGNVPARPCSYERLAVPGSRGNVQNGSWETKTKHGRGKSDKRQLDSKTMSTMLPLHSLNIPRCMNSEWKTVCPSAFSRSRARLEKQLGLKTNGRSATASFRCWCCFTLTYFYCGLEKKRFRLSRSKLEQNESISATQSKGYDRNTRTAVVTR